RACRTMSSNRNDLEIFFPRAQLTTRGVEHARRTRRRRKKNSPQRTRRGREGIHRGGHGEEGLTANDESAPQRARRRREKDSPQRTQRTQRRTMKREGTHEALHGSRELELFNAF